MLSTLSTLGYAPTMAPAPTVARAAAPSMMDLGGLKEQAKQLNPVVGYYDPLGLGSKEFWGNTEEARPRRPRLGRRRWAEPAPAQGSATAWARLWGGHTAAWVAHASAPLPWL